MQDYGINNILSRYSVQLFDCCLLVDLCIVGSISMYAHGFLCSGDEEGFVSSNLLLCSLIAPSSLVCIFRSVSMYAHSPLCSDEEEG